MLGCDWGSWSNRGSRQENGVTDAQIREEIESMKPPFVSFKREQVHWMGISTKCGPILYQTSSTGTPQHSSLMPPVGDMNAHTNGVTNTEPMEALLEPKKLVLCFDGTGNTFSGSNADTNVVKLLNKLDRHAPPGIGTYDINETSVNKSWLGEMHSSIAMTIDQGIGNTFDAHVMAGYRFLMKYYDTGAKIYMFGFSRGAFTAKFLARMVNTVGLLCKGNEEMVPFAYRLYQRYLAGEVEDFTTQQLNCDNEDCESADGDGTNPMLEDNEQGDHTPHGHNFELAHNEVTAFSNTFCRKEQVTEVIDSKKVTEDRNIKASSVMRNLEISTNVLKVYFLGIWDCVNSVAPLERHTPVPVPVKGTAQFVRHAVAVDERRVKFKPALLSQDIRATADNDGEDIKEVWWTIWQKVRNIFTTRKPTEATRDVRADPFQMSDIPLAWMIYELGLVGETDKAASIQFSKNLGGFQRAFLKRKKEALTGVMHDSLKFGYGTGFFKVLLWKFMEALPITRWELEKNVWKRVRFLPNKGAARDIPRDAVLHESLIWRLRNDPTYCPVNNHGDILPPCLKHNGDVAPVTEVKSGASNQGTVGITSQAAQDPDHQTYVFVD
ncbi:hypothetical protein CHU98_g5282 [Xylaria longipes]|nr:hypothetical protein CHU98_g5282 [Xylaria longipes]